MSYSIQYQKDLLTVAYWFYMVAERGEFDQAHCEAFVALVADIVLDASMAGPGNLEDKEQAYDAAETRLVRIITQGIGDMTPSQMALCKSIAEKTSRKDYWAEVMNEQLPTLGWEDTLDATFQEADSEGVPR